MLTRTHLLLVTSVLLFSGTGLAQRTDEEETDTSDAEAVSSWRRPLASRNQFPLALLFLQMVPDRAGSLAPGRTELGLRFDYSNIISEEASDDELVAFDLEYLRTNLELKRGFARGLELGVSIPFYVYWGGFLDPFVGAFHDAFGLPNFLRGQTPNGLVRYEYLRGDEVVFRGQDAFGTIGDVTVHFKKTLLEGGANALAVRSSLKLPTGEPEKLSGSGKTDVGFGIAYDYVGERFGVYGNANYHVLGESERIPAKNFFSVMGAADWRFKPHLAAVLQFDHARPPLDGELGLFNEGAQQLALGLRWRYSDRFVYEWRLVEDLSDVSPDFTFAFEMRVRLGAALP